MVQGRTVAAFACCALVFQNTALVILLKLSFRPDAVVYDPSTVVLTTEVAKLVLCSCMTLNLTPHDLVPAVREVRSQALLLAPSLLYVLQNNLLFLGAKMMSPVAYVVCCQAKLLSTAVMSQLLLGVKLSRAQYASLCLLAAGVMMIQSEDAQQERLESSRKMSGSGLGVFYVLLASWLSGTAGVILEKIFKSARPATSMNIITHSLWTRNVQLSVISIPLATIAVLINHKFPFRTFFAGYDCFVWSIVGLQAAGGIITAYVMKFANSVVKCLAVAISICLCALYALVVEGSDMSLSVLIGIIMVNTAVLAYSFYPRIEDKV